MKKKRLGRVVLDLEYVVDLDDEQMVEHAKESIYEDIMSLFKYNDIHNCIGVVEDTNAKEEDIPEFLLEKTEDWL